MIMGSVSNKMRSRFPYHPLPEAAPSEGARKMIAAFRPLSARPLNVNVFCHQPAKLDTRVESAWIERLRPEFAQFATTPPTHLTEIYRSFVEDDDKLAALLQEKPKVVSFHFGLPALERVRALRDAGIILLASVTNPTEVQAVAEAGIHAVVAKGRDDCSNVQHFVLNNFVARKFITCLTARAYDFEGVWRGNCFRNVIQSRKKRMTPFITKNQNAIWRS